MYPENETDDNDSNNSDNLPAESTEDTTVDLAEVDAELFIEDGDEDEDNSEEGIDSGDQGVKETGSKEKAAVSPTSDKSTIDSGKKASEAADTAEADAQKQTADKSTDQKAPTKDMETPKTPTATQTQAKTTDPSQPAPAGEPQPGDAVPQPGLSPEPQVPVPIQLTPEEAQKQFDDWQKVATGELAKFYSLNDEEVVAIEEDPGKFMSERLPQFAARVYMDAVTTSIHRVMQALPQVVDSVINHQQKARESEQSFYNVWPGLKEHSDQVLRFGKAYRQLYPTAPAEQFINDVGAQVAVALKLQPEALQAKIEGQASEAAKSKSTNNAKSSSETQAHFTPVGGSSPASSGPKSHSNPFTATDEELFEQDELDTN